MALTTHTGQIALINLATDRIEREKTFNYKFGDITSSRSDNYLYAVAVEKKKVIKININTLLEEDSYNVGNGADGIEISKDNNTLFISNRDDGTITTIDLVNNRTDVIETGGKPELINSNHDHSQIYVSNFELNTMHVIDTKTNDIIANISNLDGPEGAFYDRLNKTLYVANFNSNEVLAFRDSDYSKSTHKFTTGKNPLSVVGIKDKLYVSCYGDNAVSVIKL